MNGRSMKKAVAAAAVAACAAFAAVAASEQMASKKLVDKRVYEVSTNLTMKLAKAKEEIIDLVASLHAASTNDETIARKNSTILCNLAACAFAGIDAYSKVCTNVGEQVESSTEAKYTGCYLAWDGKRGWTTCATNAYAGICSWQKVSIDGATTNYTLWVTTPEGERYDCISSPSFNPANLRTYVCTTNNSRRIALRSTRLDEASYKIVMGIE